MLINIYKRIIINGRHVIVQAPRDTNVLIGELQVIIKLPSIAEMPAYNEDPLLSETQKDALFWLQANSAQNKKIATFWEGQPLLEFVIFRREPYYLENLLSRFTSLSSLTLQAGSSLSLEVLATNSGLLGNGDSITIWGQAEVLGV